MKNLVDLLLVFVGVYKEFECVYVLVLVEVKVVVVCCVGCDVCCYVLVGLFVYEVFIVV